MEQELMAANAPEFEPAQPIATGDAGAAAGMENTEIPPAEPPSVEPDLTQTQAFAHRLREMSEQQAQELAQQKIDAFYRQAYESQPNPYTGKPVETEADYQELMRQYELEQMASKSGLTVEQQQEQIRRAMQSDPEYQRTQARAQQMESVLLEQRMHGDLEKIRAHNPKESARHVGELGDTYLNCIRLGMDAVTAYEVARQERQRVSPPPPSMGDVGTGGANTSGFLTVDEVRSMSPEEVNTKWDLIQESRKHW